MECSGIKPERTGFDVEGDCCGPLQAGAGAAATVLLVAAAGNRSLLNCTESTDSPGEEACGEVRRSGGGRLGCANSLPSSRG